MVRSSVGAAITAAPVWVMPGRWEIKNLNDLLHSAGIGGGEIHPQPVGNNIPAALAGKVRRDDLLHHAEHVPDGELTVCACGFPADLDPAVERRVMAHLSELVIKCQRVGPDERLVVLSVPPPPRFD